MSAFIETGTHFGNTSAWASGIFDRVVTIEGAPYYHAEAIKLHAAQKNIQFLLGDSRILLKNVLDDCHSTAILWLDAHWMGTPNVFGKKAECPVFDEISAVLASNPDHIILIDDARFFLTPPPHPHHATDWPTISELLAKLDPSGKSERYTVIHDDVIVSVVASARSKVQDYYQQIATEDMNRVTEPPVVAPWDRIKRKIKRGLMLSSGRNSADN